MKPTPPPVLEEEEDDFVLDLYVSDQLPKEPPKPLFSIVLVDGCSGMAEINGSRYPFLSPCAFMINENERLSIEKQGGKLKTQVVSFHPTIINSLFDYEAIRAPGEKNAFDPVTQDLYWLSMFIYRYGSYVGMIQLNPITYKKCMALVSTIQKRLQDKEDLFWICRSRSYFIELLIFLSQIYAENPQEAAISLEEAGGLVDDIILYLHANYSKKITLALLSQEFGINRTTANALFQEKTGDPIITYLIKLRLNVASILLRDTNIPIKDISDRVGYQNLYNFSRAFKDKMGCPPAQYRHTFKVSFC